MDDLIDFVSKCTFESKSAKMPTEETAWENTKQPTILLPTETKDSKNTDMETEDPKKSNNATTEGTTKRVVANAWGSIFCKKPGSWQCEVCSATNDANLKCLCCKTVKPGSNGSEQSSKKASSGGDGFAFGAPSAARTSVASSGSVGFPVGAPSAAGTSGSGAFTFGAPSATMGSSVGFAFGVANRNAELSAAFDQEKASTGVGKVVTQAAPSPQKKGDVVDERPDAARTSVASSGSVGFTVGAPSAAGTSGSGAFTFGAPSATMGSSVGFAFGVANRNAELSAAFDQEKASTGVGKVVTPAAPSPQKKGDVVDETPDLVKEKDQFEVSNAPRVLTGVSVEETELQAAQASEAVTVVISNKVSGPKRRFIGQRGTVHSQSGPWILVELVGEESPVAFYPKWLDWEEV